MKKKTKLMKLYLILAICLVITGCPRQNNNQVVQIDLGTQLKKVLDKEDNTKQVRSVTVFPDNVIMNIGETKKLTVTIKYTDDTTDTNITWDNPNSKIITITPDGTILALSSGKVTLTGIASRDAEKRINVNVSVIDNKVVEPSATANPFQPISANKDVIPGKAGYAIQFNGIDSFVSIPTSDLLNVSFSLTMEAWVNIKKFSESSEGSFFPVILKGTQAVRYGMIINSNNTVEVKLDNNKLLIQDKTYSLNTWYHIAVTWDGSAVTLYRNGILAGSVPYQADMLSVGETSTLYLGTDLSAREKFADGQLDNVRIWNYSLNQDEIRENMHANLKGDDLGLVGYWKFDEGSGNFTADFSDSRSKGTLVNRSRWIVSSALILTDK